MLSKPANIGSQTEDKTVFLNF